MAVSNNITGALNLVAMILSLPIIGTGIWLATREDAECVRVLRWPLIVVGTILLLISFAGFVGAFWRVQYLLVIYLIFMLIFIVLLLAFVIFAFIVTNKGGGHTVPGRNYKEYQISDFSGWLRNYVEKNSHWNQIERCLSSSDQCQKLNQRYLSAQDFFNAHLTPLETVCSPQGKNIIGKQELVGNEGIGAKIYIWGNVAIGAKTGYPSYTYTFSEESGCCKPPTFCGYTFVNPTFWVSPTNQNADVDCMLWSNDQLQLCYNCNSCKAGVLGNIKREWKKINIILIVALVALIWVYLVGCSAFRNAQTEDLFRRYKERFTS